MLPERLSNDLCSLRPRVPRLTVSAVLEIDGAGRVVSEEFHPSVIKTVERMTYASVTRIFEGDRVERERYGHVVPALLLMRELARLLRARRAEDGSLDFDLLEPELVYSEGTLTSIVPAGRSESNQLIEEFMVAANVAVAARLARSGVPALYRIHPAPAVEDLEKLRELLSHFGLVLPRAERIGPRDLQAVLERMKGRPGEKFVNVQVLRSLKMAVYADENLGHYGLAKTDYTHFTSPIRRYPDLVVHRALKRLLSGAKTEKASLEALALHVLAEGAAGRRVGEGPPPLADLPFHQDEARRGVRRDHHRRHQGRPARRARRVFRRRDAAVPVARRRLLRPAHRQDPSRPQEGADVRPGRPGPRRPRRLRSGPAPDGVLPEPGDGGQAVIMTQVFDVSLDVPSNRPGRSGRRSSSSGRRPMPPRSASTRADPAAPGRRYARATAGLPFYLRWKDPFEVLDAAREPLGRGIVLQPVSEDPKKLSAPKRLARLDLLAGGPKDMILALAEAKGFEGLREKEILEFSGLTPEDMETAAGRLEEEGKARILAFSPLFILSQESFDFLCGRILEFVGQFHAKHPESRGVAVEKIVKRFELPEIVGQLALKHLLKTRAVQVLDGLVSLADFKVPLSAAEEAILAEMEKMCYEGRFAAVSLDDVRVRFRLSPARLQALLGMLAEKRRVVQSKDGFTIHSTLARRDRPAAPGEGEGRALGRRLQGDDGAVAQVRHPPPRAPGRDGRHEEERPRPHRPLNFPAPVSWARGYRMVRFFLCL